MNLHIRDVSKTFSNGVPALKDVTLTIPVGMYGLLGPNGAGKSTLMRIPATLWDVGTAQAVVKPTGTGEHEVTLVVRAKKMRTDSVGNETNGVDVKAAGADPVGAGP